MRRMCPPRGLHAARVNQAENSRPTCMRRMCPPRGLHAARMNQAENSPQWTVFSPDSSTVAAGELAQGLHVEDMHFPLVDVQQTFAGEPREQPAYGFKCKAEVVADFFPAHAQHEFVG